MESSAEGTTHCLLCLSDHLCLTNDSGSDDGINYNGDVQDYSLSVEVASVAELGRRIYVVAVVSGERKTSPL